MSLFWTTCFPTLLDDAVPAGAPLATLGNLQSYAPIFNTLLTSPEEPVTPPTAGATALELPWPPTKNTHWFWCRYLNANPIQRVSGSFAFVRLVPLRRHSSPAPGLGVKLPEKLASTGKVVIIEHVLGEAWFHPHMVTFAVHFTVSGEMTPEEMSKLCIELRCGRVLFMQGDSALYKLDEVAANRLDALYLEAVGVESAGPLPPANPFSVVTVLQGDGADGQPIVDGGDIHRILETVTQWGAAKAGPLDAGRITSRPQTLDGSILFGHKRSRAVWDPERFSTSGGASLSCYHRNLFVGTMQTEALLSFARVAEEEAAMQRRPKAIRDCEDPVLKRIIALHNAEVTTYRSAALRRFINDHVFRSSVDTMAQRIQSTVKLPSLVVQPISFPPNSSNSPVGES